MFAKIINGALVKYPYYIEDMRADYPDVWVDDDPTDEQLSACSARRASMGASPKHSSRTHSFELSFSDNEDGSVSIVTVAHELPVHVAEFNMRDARNAALTRCDWVITRAYESGQPIPEAYVEYRQKLRDLPSQEGFPYDYVWPVAP